MSVAEDIRRTFLEASEPLSVEQLMKLAGATRSNTNMTIRTMEKAGFRFHRTNIGAGKLAYEVVQEPGHTNGSVPEAADVPPTDDDKTAARKATDRARKAKARKAKKTQKAQPPAKVEAKPKKVSGPPMPALGQAVQVNLLKLEDDGRLLVGFKTPGAEGTWLCEVQGYAS